MNRLVSATAAQSGYANAYYTYRADGMRVRELYDDPTAGGAALARAGAAAAASRLAGGEISAQMTSISLPVAQRERVHRYDGQMPMEVCQREAQAPGQ